MADVKARAKRFLYKNAVKWEAERRGSLSSPGKPDIKIATPPEFKGHAGIWTPEDFLVASVNACIMTTFLYYAEKKALKFLKYESEAEGILENVNSRFMFSKITIRPAISVAEDADIEKAKEIISVSERHCLISNSVSSEVEVDPTVSLKA